MSGVRSIPPNGSKIGRWINNRARKYVEYSLSPSLSYVPLNCKRPPRCCEGNLGRWLAGDSRWIYRSTHIPYTNPAQVCETGHAARTYVSQLYLKQQQKKRTWQRFKDWQARYRWSVSYSSVWICNQQQYDVRRRATIHTEKAATFCVVRNCERTRMNAETIWEKSGSLRLFPSQCRGTKCR